MRAATRGQGVEGAQGPQQKKGGAEEGAEGTCASRGTGKRRAAKPRGFKKLLWSIAGGAGWSGTAKGKRGRERLREKERQSRASLESSDGATQGAQGHGAPSQKKGRGKALRKKVRLSPGNFQTAPSEPVITSSV